MPKIELGEASNIVIHHANKHAVTHKHSHLDSKHIFLSLLEFSEAGKLWLNAQDGDTNITYKLKTFLHNRSHTHTHASTTQPSVNYVNALRQAKKFATEAKKQVITPSDLLEAVFAVDSMLRKWILDHGLNLNPASQISSTPILDKMGSDLTTLARQNKLSNVIGRDKEIAQIKEVLLRRGKNSIMLIGKPGVGKSKLVERLALEIARQDVPDRLLQSRLIEIHVSNLVAGTGIRGVFEERLQQLIHELEQNENIIIVIDEFHTLMGTGATNGSGLDASNILKPALASGNITCIGITTNEEFTKYIEPDGAFVRRFERVRINEPNEAETLRILRGIRNEYEQHHQLHVEDTALETIIQLTSNYLPSRCFPDKGVDVLGRVCSRAEIAGQKVVGPAMVNAVVSEISGLHIGQVTSDVRDFLSDFEGLLSQWVIGQDEAIQVIARAVRLSYSDLNDPDCPNGVFMFIGPSGVGKTELAKSLAEVLFGDPQHLIRFDMSEYKSQYDVTRLLGASPGYVGYEESGQLTKALHAYPYSVVLLDEIEKAHPQVFDVFLRLFDEGRITDNHGRLIDGRHAFFIMTSNLGNNVQMKRDFGFNNRTQDEAQDTTPTTIKNHFRPEFLNRIDHIISFRSLDIDDLVDITAKELQQLRHRLEQQNIKLTIERDVADAIAEDALTRGAGARGVSKAIETLITIPVSNELLNSKQTGTERTWLHVESQDNKINIGWI